MKRFRIIHFSDLHLGNFSFAHGGWRDKRLLGRANFLLFRQRQIRLARIAQAIELFAELQPDLLLCTGDLTCVSDPQEFAAAEKILAPLLEWAGPKFVYVPGNHDAYVGRAECRRALRETFYRLNHKRFELPELPLALRFGEVELLLLNSAEPRNWLSSGGTFTPAAQEHLDELLSQPSAGIRLLINHFPIQTASGAELPWRRRLAGADILRQWQSRGRFAALFCGHIRRPFLADTSIGRQICAGSLSIQGSFLICDLNLSSLATSTNATRKGLINATISGL